MITIKHGDRPVGHDNLGFARSNTSDLHLISFETWNNTSFCGQNITGPITQHAAGRLCDLCSQLTGISHTGFAT